MGVTFTFYPKPQLLKSLVYIFDSKTVEDSLWLLETPLGRLRLKPSNDIFDVPQIVDITWSKFYLVPLTGLHRKGLMNILISCHIFFTFVTDYIIISYIDLKWKDNYLCGVYV